MEQLITVGPKVTKETKMESDSIVRFSRLFYIVFGVILITGVNERTLTSLAPSSHLV